MGPFGLARQIMAPKQRHDDYERRGRFVSSNSSFVAAFKIFVFADVGHIR